MAEHRDDAVPRTLPELESLEVGDACINSHVAIARQSPGLHHTDRTQVDGDDLVPVLGEEHAISTFTIADAQCFADWQLLDDIAEEVVGLSSEGESFFGVPLIP
jgi:hypothetical protein